MPYTKFGLLLIFIVTLTLSGCVPAMSAAPLPPAKTTSSSDATPAGTSDPASEKEYHLKISAVGDIMCHMPQMDAARTPSGYDFREPFDILKPELTGADLLIGNLETTFSGASKTYSEFPTFNTPDAFAEALADAGFDILTTANNHALDRRFYGLSRTLDVLDRYKILHTGTFRTETDDRILMAEKNNIQVAVIAYTYGTNGIQTDKSKTFSLNRIDEATIRADIATAKERGAELILVALHFGQEYQEQPNPAQERLVSACFDEGADIVLGTHPHVIQKQVLEPITDRYGVTKNRFVAYSLGNFLSGQRTYPRAAGMIAHLDVVKKKNVTEVESADFLPTWVDQSTGSGLSTFRILPLKSAMDNPDQYGSLTGKDRINLERSWRYVTAALGKTAVLASMPAFR